MVEKIRKKRPERDITEEGKCQGLVKRGVDCGRRWSSTEMKETCRDQIRQWQEIVNVY